MLTALLVVVPAILIRWVFLKKQLTIVYAIIYSLVISIIIGAILYYYLETKNSGLSGFAAVASFFIQIAKSNNIEKENEVSNDKT